MLATDIKQSLSRLSYMYIIANKSPIEGVPVIVVGDGALLVMVVVEE